MNSKKLEINVIIDGKKQELHIDPESEEIVREAAKRVNNTLFDYRRDFKLDAGDYLRMVALNFAIENVEREYAEKASTLLLEMTTLENKLSEHISNVKL